MRKIAINLETEKRNASRSLPVNNFAFFLFKKFNIIKKGINIKDTMKLYAVLFSCFIYAKAVGF